MQLAALVLFGFLTGASEAVADATVASAYPGGIFAFFDGASGVGAPVGVNTLDHNPWVIQVAGGDVLLPDWASVRAFRWVHGSAEGHRCVVTDADGRVLWEAIADDSGYFQDASEYPEHKGLPVKGLKVPTLGSGTLYIYFRTSPPEEE